MASRARAKAGPRPNGIVTLLTDFGTGGVFAGIMKGVLLRVNPLARLVDLTHEIPPHDVLAGALLLRSAVRYFPAGTVHLAVVDPGVGGTRRALALAAGDALLVGPDNGLLSLAANALGISRAHAIDIAKLAARKFSGGPISQTFHGRDVFAPVAAQLSMGVPLASVGPAVENLEELRLPVCRAGARAITGQVIHVDRFGNLITNVALSDLRQLGGFSEDSVYVSIHGERIDGIVPAYATVPEGALLAIIGSWELLEIAVRNGNAAHRFGVTRGARVRIGAIRAAGRRAGRRD